MLLTAPGRAFLAGPGRPLLTGASATAGPTGPATGPAGFTGPYPSDIPNLSGWWDAGTPTALLTTAGQPAAWGSVVASLMDKSGASRPATPYHFYPGGTPAALIATPRLNGTLGGLGALAAMASYAPSLDPDTGLALPALSFAPDTAWTRCLVWSRPNRRQGTYYVNANPVALLSSGGQILISLSSNGGTLTLFPAAAAAVLNASLTRRHTHCLILRNTPGQGVDAWLDGAPVATAIANPLPSGTPGPCRFGHDGTLQGAAQLWFHEMASWERALTAGEIATLGSAMTRWTLGARKGASLLIMGQSNAGLFWLSGAGQIMANGLAWYLGALAGNLVVASSGSYVNPPRYTQVSGHPISNSTAPLFPPGAGNGTYLTNPGDGSAPSLWALGPDGQATIAYLNGASAVLPAEDLADIAAIVWPWTEQDSTAPYSQKDLYAGTVKRLAALIRADLGRTAASLPLLMWNAIPYQTDPGMQMVREAVADLAGDPTQNLHVFAAQTADSIALNATYDPATGLSTVGDPNHRDETDEIAFGRRGAHVAARAVLAAGGADSLPAIAAGMPLAGPRIAGAVRESATSLLVTIAHDQGTDLRLPLQAANGAGWTVMAGGNPAAPGPLIAASAAARVDATHLRLTLASPLTAAAPLLFYPWGSREIGRGDAVTDNFSAIGFPAGSDMAAELGAAWLTDLPLAATAYGIPVEVPA